MLTYKDSLRQRLYSDSFEEGLRFGIKYFAKKVLYELKDLANKKFKLGNKTYDYFQLRGMNLSDEAMLAAANAKGTTLTNNGEFVLKGGKNFKAAQNNEAYQNMINEHGGTGFGGDYSKYGDWYDKLDPTIQARLGGKMKEKEFKKMMTGQHDLEREYASQYFGGNSGNGGSGSGKEEGGVLNWIKNNPGKTAAIGGGALVTGLGARALLKGRDDRDDRYYR